MGKYEDTVRSEMPGVRMKKGKTVIVDVLKRESKKRWLEKFGDC